MGVTKNKKFENLVLDVFKQEYINQDEKTGMYYFSYYSKEYKFGNIYNVKNIKPNTAVISALLEYSFTDKKFNQKQKFNTPIYAFVKKDQIDKAKINSKDLVFSLKDLNLDEESFIEFTHVHKGLDESGFPIYELCEFPVIIDYKKTDTEHYIFEQLGVKENSITFLASNF